jgi:transposase
VGKKTGPNPTDRAKSGTKRSLLTDARGVPLGLVAAGANTNDFKLVRATLESIPVERPTPTEHRHQHLCVDKGYAYEEVRQLAEEFGFTLHVPRGRKAPKVKKRSACKKPRRWVVERGHSWLNRFRRLLVRWEKREDTYLAMLHFALGLITWFHSLLPK